VHTGRTFTHVRASYNEQFATLISSIRAEKVQ
jgi:hypothetical protein